MTEPQIGGTYDELLALARWSEDNGLYSFARSDHYYSAQRPAPDATDAFATLAGLARDTDRIRLAVLVSPVTFRHPAVIAKSAATIDQMSGGRLDLGVGTGWMEEEHLAFGLPFPPRSERFARLEEAVDYLTAAFAPDHGFFEGDHYRLDAEVNPKPTGIRIILGGQGPTRTPRLAGEKADEYNCFGKPADEVAARIEVMRKAAGDREVTATVMGPTLVGRSDREYRERLEVAAKTRGVSTEKLEERFDEMGLPIGPPARAKETLDALAEAGVERYYVQWLAPGDVDGFAVTIEALRM